MAAVLRELADTPADGPASTDPQPRHAELQDVAKRAHAEIDESAAQAPSSGDSMLADGGRALDAAIAADPEVARKFADALALFGECETRLLDAIKTELRAR